jgi:hypothetical protein
MAISIDLAIGSSAASGGGGGGSVNTGVLQVSGGGALSGTLQTITDQSSNASPLQLSTTSVNFTEQVTLTKSGGIIASGLVGLTRFVGLYADNDPAIAYSASNGLRIATVANISGGGFSERARFDNNGNFVLGTTTASARLHVRGDGTNPIARFENNSGASSLSINASGTFHQYGSNGAVGMYVTNQAGAESISGQAINWYSNITSFAGFGFRMYGNSNHNYTSGTGGMLEVGGNIVAAAGSANFRPLSIAYTINNSGAQTGTATGIFLNATETALNGMTHNLMDLQRGGVSQFNVRRDGQTTINGEILGNSNIRVGSGWALYWSGAGQIISIGASASVFLITDASQANFGRLQLGGTTNAFPAIKRNGAGIDFRLADDSAFCRVDIGSGSRSYGEYRFCDTVGNNAAIFYGQGLANGLRTFWMNGGQILFSGSPSGGLVSAAIQIDSTTQGFLPSRMTTTQKNAIATPATGLVLYDTTLNKLAVYTGSAWETVTSL